MPRNKVKLAYIVNNAERKASYRKRSTSLVNKVKELNTLCDVETCVVIYGEFDQEPIVWPSRIGVLSAIQRFNALPDIDKLKSMSNNDDYTRERLNKVLEKVYRLGKEIKIKEMEDFLGRCIAGEDSLESYNFDCNESMRCVAERFKREIESRVGPMNNGASTSGSGGPATAFGTN